MPHLQHASLWNSEYDPIVSILYLTWMNYATDGRKNCSSQGFDVTPIKTKRDAKNAAKIFNGALSGLQFFLDT